jgi:transcription termination factor NusB
VAIDEAIGLARRFGGEESGQFVNGVLDALRKKLQQTEEKRP